MVRNTGALLKRRFHGLMRPMKLKSSVRMSGKTVSSAACLSEMTAVMSCWKASNFDDVPCRKEIEEFIKCAVNSRLTPQDIKPEGGFSWSTEEANARLRKFVWAQ